VPADAKLEVVWNDGDFTEGPVATAKGTILFTDIGNRIMEFDPASGKTSVFREPSGKANGLMIDQQGRLIACEGAGAGGNRRISVTTNDGEVKTLCDNWEGKRFNSPNDLAIDARSRVYFTDPRYVGDDPREIDFEGVFLVDLRGIAKLATRDLQKPNGILVSIDGKHVYVADNNPSGNRHLLRFDVQADGTLAEKKVLFDFGSGRRGIDGMTLDVDGNLYATAGTGDEAGIYVFSPEGKHLAFLATPGDPTNCVFGYGSDLESRTLYITGNGPKTEAARRYALYRIPLAKAGHRIYPK
jgi:gluconolactonase